MNRNLGLLGLVLVMTFVVSATLAPAAWAATDLFNSEKTATVLTGEQVQKNKFTLAGQTVECETVSFSGTMTGTVVAEVKTVEPKLGGCTSAGAEAIFRVNGCKLNFNGTTDANGDAQVSIVDCNSDKSIEFSLTGTKCVLTVKAKGATDGNQVAEEGVKYTNDGAGATRGLLADGTVKLPITSEPEAGQSETLACATLTNSTGTLHGTVTVTGEEDPSGNHVGVWAE
jgi:hypothetical protein